MHTGANGEIGSDSKVVVVTGREEQINRLTAPQSGDSPPALKVIVVLLLLNGCTFSVEHAK
jgi:hypothetical protein